MLDTPYPTVIPGPPRPSSILTPRDMAGHHGRERQTIPGGGAWLLQLGQGDQITLVNDEGGQAVELIAARPDGRIDAAVLGHSANSDAGGLKAMLALGESAGPGLSRLRLGLARRGIDLAKAGAIRLFGSSTPARSTQGFTAQTAGWLIVCAPGLPMAPAAQDGKFDLPDPLADPLLDLRVRSATAETYTVKAGDYIQIIDVDGRQCTDFQCFDARKLDRGLQHALDVTT